MKSFEVAFSDLMEEAGKSFMGQSRAWLQCDEASVYIRMGGRLVRQVRTPCVQIATVDVPQEKQKSGQFKSLIARIRAMTDLPIYVENVLNVEFGDALLRHGFEVVRDDHFSRDFVRLS
jgi:hypothetical protein